MRFDELRERSQQAGIRASDVARQLALGGVAASWLFSSQYFLGHDHRHPDGLVLALGALSALALGLDILQVYIYASSFELAYVRADRKIADSEDPGDQLVGGVGAFADIATTALFWAKLVAIVAGFGCLAAYLIGLAG
jgi:hypothetical protein